LIDALREKNLRGRIGSDVPLARHTSYGIGGPAEVLVEPADAREVAIALRVADDLGAPVHMLGAGSNVLVSDDGLEGLVLRIAENLGGVAVDGDLITARAGSSDREVALAAARSGMTGFEFLEDIPGTVGGGLVQNAEAYGDSISDHLVDVTVCSLRGEITTFAGSDLTFGYRDSTFKNRTDLVILEARFAPPGRDDPQAISARMDVIRDKRHARYPLDLPSCGSVFKRPEGDFAGRLIEVAGLGGLSVGGARVSRRHHNFIVNTGSATAADIRHLIEKVVHEVHRQFGVTLVRELIYLGNV
jgi:UDP-N-acetylmuramate dehydrogenase